MNNAIEKAFLALQESMCTTLFLAVPNFTKTFVLKCNAQGIGLGAVLIKEWFPLAFNSKRLCSFLENFT